VTLFKGFPFLLGSSEVRAIDSQTGAQSSFIPGLTTAVDVAQFREGGDTHFLVLQHASEFTLPPFESSGLLLRFETPGGSPTIMPAAWIPLLTA